ncbi:MAG: PRC-barrel domain-containing protein, partial [Thermodesulfobacteriota bacterium]
SEVSNEERHLWERTFNDWEKAISNVNGSSKAIKGDELFEYKIEEPEGKMSGTIKDLVIDPEDITVTYAVVSLINKSQESAGDKAKLYVIPINLLKLNSEKTFDLRFDNTKNENVSEFEFLKSPEKA